MAHDDKSNGDVAPAVPHLEVEKLHALPTEQQELYLLTFTSDVARFVAGLDHEAATAQQMDVKKELMTVIGLSSPQPTRVIRNNLSNSFAGVVGKGDRKILFDSINELVEVLSSSKGPKDGSNKHAALYCLGALYQVAGDSAISLSGMTCAAITRAFKNASNHVGFRSATLTALGKICIGIEGSLDEQIARDTWKLARQAATTDKALLVQGSACWCTEQLFCHTPYFDNSADFLKMQAVIFKVIESASPTVRRAAASCISAVYVKHFTEAPTGLAPKPKKTRPKSRMPAGATDIAEEGAEPPPTPPPVANDVSFGMMDIIKQLTAQYCRASTTNRGRAGVISICLKVFHLLGEDVVKDQYPAIARHLFSDMLNSPSVVHNRYRLLITRRFVRIILEELIGGTLLGETGQLDAVRFLVNLVKDYPQSDVPERPEPSKQALIGALDALSSFFDILGSAAGAQADSIRGAILQVLEHPSYSVQIHASRCLKRFVLACPSQMLASATICMNSVDREMKQLSGPRRAPRKCVGYALGLAAAISVSASQPLYGSVDVYSRVLTQATSILKSSGGQDLRLSSIQVQVAYTMIGGLMSLGPSFVKIHLSQLMLLWRNALTRPAASDNLKQRNLVEVSFLAHVRECALSSIMAFLSSNGRLLTLDIARRLATMLQNTIFFCFDLPAKKTTEDPEKRLSSAMQLQDYDCMVRRRVFQSYTKLLALSPPEALEDILQSKVLSLATSSFADPEEVQAISLSASIASSSGTTEGIWDVGDNSGSGVTSLVNGLRIAHPDDPADTATEHWLSQSNLDSKIDRIIYSPICNDLEHDSIHLYTELKPSASPPLASSVVDTAIRLFAAMIPFRSSKVQLGAFEQIQSMIASDHSSQAHIREVALNINVGAAIFYALNNPLRDSAMSQSRSTDVERALQELLHRFLVHSDLATRHLAAQGLGRLCKSSGTDFTAKEVSFLVDLIVSNPSPSVRSGCAIALGSIMSQLGGMAAGLHMKTILGILTSLASDSHPVVHFWALDGLSRIADATGPSFLTYVSSTLGKLAQLYFAESHGEESSLIPTSNYELDLPSLAVIARCIDSMINVLGPALRDMNKERNMILTLTYQFQTERSTFAASESLKCLQNLSMYAPGQISFSPYLKQLQAKILSDDPDVQRTALTGLYNAMRRGAEEVVNAADAHLEDQMWTVLHNMHGVGLMRQILRDWVEQTGISRIDLWVPRIQRVLTRIRSHRPPLELPPGSTTAPQPPDDDEEALDEEVAGFAASAAHTAKDNPGQQSEASQELLRWQVRCTAMESLNDILSTVAEDVAVNEDSDYVVLLQPRVSDMIRLAFAASTAHVIELRIQGVQIIGRLLQIFGKVPDPDFPEATLLEQYQAQISSALTPAFATDSSPILAAEAVSVCGSFISAGIVTNVERMGRILRLLVSALEDFSRDKESVAIGDLKGLSSNAQIMVKLAVYSAWAELQIACHDQNYLRDIIAPHLLKLTPLWLKSLREYARLKFEPEISASATGGITTGSLDEIYAALSREILLTFYQNSWLNFVDAIASLIDEDSDFVFDALDDKPATPMTNGQTRPKISEINYRDEPVAFFFVLFGISFEALVNRPNDDTIVVQKRIMDILQALRKITSRAVAGRAIYQDAVFSETMDVFDRLALTERAEVQGVIVDVARNLCIAHPSARRADDDPEGDEQLSEDIEQLFELTRLIVLVVSKHVPSISEAGKAARSETSPQSVPLIIQCLTALVDCAEVFPSIIKSDLHACILNTFSSIFGTPSCQQLVVPSALPVFRRFTASLGRSSAGAETREQLRSMLARISSIVKHAQQRETDAAVPAERNSLLAGTILLSGCGRLFAPSDPLVTRFIHEVADCMDNSMTTKVAAGLSRSLLLLPTLTAKPSATESAISSHLLTYLLLFLTKPSTVDGTAEARTVVAGTLVGFCAAVPKDQRTAATFLTVPTLLRRAQLEGQGVWTETSTLLLELAKRDAGGFRAVVGRLQSEQKTLLESVLKKSGAMGAGGQARDGRESERAEPSIALKMDF